MTIFNLGDRVYHSTGGRDRGVGTVTRILENETTYGLQVGVIWDVGTRRREVLGSYEYFHCERFLILDEPAFSTYDPLQAGDTAEDI